MNKGIITKSVITFLSLVLLIVVMPFSVVKADTGIFISDLSDNRVTINKNTNVQQNGNTFISTSSKSGQVTIIVDVQNNGHYTQGTKIYVDVSINALDGRVGCYSRIQTGGTLLIPQNNELWTINGTSLWAYYVTGRTTLVYELMQDYDNVNYSTYSINFNKVASNGASTTSGSYNITINSIYIGMQPYQPNDFGKLKDLGFYTNYISQPNTNKNITMSYNQDVIKWNNAVSDNNTQYNEDFKVEIHAQRFNYVAPSISILMTKTLQDMNVLPDSEIDLGSFSALKGNKEFTWKDIAAQFLGTSNVYTFFDQLSPVFDNVENVYTIYGWYYKVRLINEVDSYEGEWQIVYNCTTLPSTSDAIINNYYVNYNYTYNYEVDNSINTINEMNGTNSMYFLNNEVVNINYNDYTSNITNTTNNIDNQYNNMHEIEISLFNELDNNLQNFELKDFDTDIDNSFVSSLNWVNQQFNTALNGGNNPLGQFVYIVVSIGIVLLIVGILV